jgi:hypothetical protein
LSAGIRCSIDHINNNTMLTNEVKLQVKASQTRKSAELKQK